MVEYSVCVAVFAFVPYLLNEHGDPLDGPAA
jgi:hypothetical protein